MIKPDRVSAFFSKAEKVLNWADVSLAEMRDHGRRARIPDVERLFFCLLFQLSAARESIESACNAGGMKTWRAAFISECMSDPLLNYLWRARDLETHDAVIKWNAGGTAGQIEIVDERKANVIPKYFPHYNNKASVVADMFDYIFSVHGDAALAKCMIENIAPSPERMEKAGIKLLYASATLTLIFFSYRINGTRFRIDAPTTHLGKPIPHQADNVADSGIIYFRLKLKEAQSLFGSSQQAALLAP